MFRLFNVTEIFATLEGLPKWIRQDVWMRNFFRR